MPASLSLSLTGAELAAAPQAADVYKPLKRHLHISPSLLFVQLNFILNAKGFSTLLRWFCERGKSICIYRDCQVFISYSCCLHPRVCVGAALDPTLTVW